MKTKIKKVYYCDFCKKNGLIAYHIKEHELHCTANPNRECGMCDVKGLQHFEIIDIKNEHETFKGVIVDDEDCPACVLAFVRQNKTQAYTKDKEAWSFTEAVKRYWDLNKEDISSYY